MRILPNPSLVWVVPVSFLPLLIAFLLPLGHLRRFVLGSNYPLNEILSRSAYNAVWAAGVIAVFGAFFSLVRPNPDATALVLVVTGVLVTFASGLTGIFIRRSNSWAKKVDWPYSKVEKRGRYHGSRKVELTNTVLAYMSGGFGIVGATLILLSSYSGLLYFVGGSLLGWSLILLIPSAILNFLTRSKQDIVFERR